MRFLHYLIFLAIFQLLILGCKKDTSGDDQKPVINSITFNAETVTPGEKVTVTCSATDPQGDNLTYTWTVVQGTLSNPSNTSTDWILSPIAQVNSYAKILLTVSDGTHISTSEGAIMVAHGITVSGKAIYAGTSIPMPGLSIKLGPFTTLTSEDGKFVFLHITSGNHTIEASRPGFDTYTKVENISASNNVFQIPVTSNTETRSLSGRVKTVDNISLSGIRVVMLNDDKTESTLIDTSDINGNYRVLSVPPGTRSFKFTDVSNPGNCQQVNYDVIVTQQNQLFDVNMKLERVINILQNGWEFASADLSAPFNGTAYVLTSDNSNGNRYFRPAFCCPIPADAENPTATMTHKLTGSLRVPGGYYYKSPASSQFYMSQDCTTWVNFTNNTYTYWSSPIGTFFTEYRTISNSFKGKSIKFSLGLFRWSGSMPVWQIKSFEVTYYY